jgi:hypothetical protein
LTDLFNSLADEIFQVLKGTGKTLTLYDEKGKKVYNPPDARRFFAEPDKMMLSIDDDGEDSQIRLFLSQGTNIQDQLKLINTLRQLCNRFNVLFNVRLYGRELEPKDFAYQSLPANESQILEAMWGTTRTSYQKIGDSRLVIKHDGPIDATRRGSRSRAIRSLFVDNKLGERLRFPVIHLTGSRAFARHLDNNGKPYDNTAMTIVELADESKKLIKLNRYIRHKKLALEEKVQEIIPVIKNRIAEIRTTLSKTSGKRGYHTQLENLVSYNLTETNQNLNMITELAELFGITLEDELAEALIPLARTIEGKNMADAENKMQIHANDVTRLKSILSDEYGYNDGKDFWNKPDTNQVVFNNHDAFEAALDYIGDHKVHEAEDQYDPGAPVEGDLVVTFFGEGDVSEVNDDGNLNVRLKNGKMKVFAPTDVQKIGTADIHHPGEIAEIAEMSDMAEWFEQFNPENVIKELGDEPRDVKRFDTNISTLDGNRPVTVEYTTHGDLHELGIDAVKLIKVIDSDNQHKEYPKAVQGLQGEKLSIQILKSVKKYRKGCHCPECDAYRREHIEKRDDNGLPVEESDNDVDIAIEEAPINSLPDEEEQIDEVFGLGKKKPPQVSINRRKENLLIVSVNGQSYTISKRLGLNRVNQYGDNWQDAWEYKINGKDYEQHSPELAVTDLVRKVTGDQTYKCNSVPDFVDLN